MHASNRSSLRLRDELRVTGVEPVDASLARILDWSSGLQALDERYQAVPAASNPDEFVRLMLEALNVAPRVFPRELDNVPASGPAIVASNHPFGGIDGLLLARVILGRRSDLRILANRYLDRIVELKELLIGVDVFSGPGATRANVQALREATRWVLGGGLLLMFPSGEVSHLHLTDARVTDPEWRPSVGYIARRTGAAVTPAFVFGRNSLRFQLLGCLHPSIRTALLPQEVLNKAHRRIAIRFGNEISSKQVRAFSSVTALTRYLRLRTYALSSAEPGSRQPSDERTRAKRADYRSPIVQQCDNRLLRLEFDALASARKLVRCGGLQVAYARAGEIPWIMREIARLREMTFRAAGEGTGMAMDTDRFDSSYLHLFLWHSERGQILGAYRMADVSAVLTDLGPSGLYTHSLFEYGQDFLDYVRDGLELGRSFIRPEYQRRHTPLMLLWRGIGRFVARNPRIRRLFGAVSISDDYNPVSRRFMVDYLRQARFNLALARSVRPRTGTFDRPRRFWKPQEIAELDDLDSVSEIIKVIEGGKRGLPILLRQYLNLGGELLGFNLDRSFGNAIDGLMLVDVPRVNRRMLAHFMGKEECRRYLEQQGGGQSPLSKSLMSCVEQQSTT